MGAVLMLIEKKQTEDLLPADYNPRKDLKPGDPEYEKLKRSIEQVGSADGVTVQRDGLTYRYDEVSESTDDDVIPLF